MTNTAQIQVALAQTVQTLGTPTVLLNNAGIVVNGTLEELSEAQWDRQFDVNVKSIYLVSREVIPLLRAAGGGSIINMGSESAFVGFPMHPGVLCVEGSGGASDAVHGSALCTGEDPGKFDLPGYDQDGSVSIVSGDAGRPGGGECRDYAHAPTGAGHAGRYWLGGCLSGIG